MAFRKPKKQPQFADLNGILSQSKKTDNALYQTVQEIINRLTQFQGVTLEEVAKKANTEDLTKKFATKAATYVTEQDDTSQLPNSRQVVEGDGIEIDVTTPKQLKIGIDPVLTFATTSDETPVLPSSRRLVAGTNVTFDDSVPGQRIINTTGGAGPTLVIREIPTGVIDGVNMIFTLMSTPIVGSEEVYLNGLLQEPGAGNDYTISGTTITYLAAPLIGDRLRVSYRVA